MCDHSFLGFLSTGVLSQDRADYPELLVTPRASERLKIESESEGRKPWNFQWTITFFGHDHFSGGSHAR